MVDPIRLRSATEQDAERVLALFAEHLAALDYAPDPDLDADMLLAFPRAYRDGRFLVAEQDGLLIAMGGVKDGEVRRIYVAPAHRGAGLAVRIIAELITLTPGKLVAIVARQNQTARRTFLAAGFVPTGHAPAHPKMEHCEILERG